jgi:hypothetical protein
MDHNRSKKYICILYEGKIKKFLLSKNYTRVIFIIFYPRIENEGKIYPRYLYKIDIHLGIETGKEKYPRREPPPGKRKVKVIE